MWEPAKSFFAGLPWLTLHDNLFPRGCSCSRVHAPRFLWLTHWLLPESRWLKEDFVQEGLCLYTSSLRSLVRTLSLRFLCPSFLACQCRWMAVACYSTFLDTSWTVICWFLVQKICASVLSRLHVDFLCIGVHFNCSCRKVLPSCL